MKIHCLTVETLHATSQIHAPPKDVACNVSTNPDKSTEMSLISPESKSLSIIIRSFKSAVSRISRQKGHDFYWQKNYHDQIIRNEKELNSIRHYIKYNPMKWEEDEYYV